MIGIQHGVRFGEGTVILMPITPTCAVALGSCDQYVELSHPAAADEINRFQIINAAKHVFYHPSSTLDGFVRSEVGNLRNPQRDGTGPL